MARDADLYEFLYFTSNASAASSAARGRYCSRIRGASLRRRPGLNSRRESWKHLSRRLRFRREPRRVDLRPGKRFRDHQLPGIRLSVYLVSSVLTELSWFDVAKMFLEETTVDSEHSSALAASVLTLRVLRTRIRFDRFNLACAVAMIVYD